MNRNSDDFGAVTLIRGCLNLASLNAYLVLISLPINTGLSSGHFVYVFINLRLDAFHHKKERSKFAFLSEANVCIFIGYANA